MRLGVNVDHIATLREARKVVDYPDPVLGALICQYAGADSVVVHLREDRRHIKERDLFFIRTLLEIELNLEMSVNKEIVEIACEIKPDKATLVPERRKEITTEGGLDLIKNERKIRRAISALHKNHIKVSVFIDPGIKQIDMAKKMGLNLVELHTGRYAEAKDRQTREKEYRRIYEAASYAKKQGFSVAAGHGLNYTNVRRISQIKYIEELNIGHSIISRAVFIGLLPAIEEMRQLIES